MLQSFVITFREGLEAFLIVAISLAFLRKSSRHDLIRPVHLGIVASVILSAIAAALLQQVDNHALWEGILALAAAITVGSLTIHMWRAGKRMKKEIEGRLGASFAKGTAAAAGVFLFILLMMTREGIETALLMSSLLLQVKSAEMIAGAVLGVLAAACVAWLWSRYGQAVNLAKFLQVTAVFLLVFVAQLLIYGFHELTEAGVLPYSEPLHWATEPYGPDGKYGQYFSYLLVILPMGWLAASYVLRWWRADAPTDQSHLSGPLPPPAPPSASAP